MNRVAVITGGSSGIGLATASALVAQGCTVWEISRRDSTCPGVLHISADISDTVMLADAAEMILRDSGHVDILINNAGFSFHGAAEFTGPAYSRRLFDVNFFAAVAACRAFIPAMRMYGGGKIINVSAPEAFSPSPFQAVYSASKAALRAYSVALADELSPLGISVICVTPPHTSSGLTFSRICSFAGNDIYSGRITDTLALAGKAEDNGCDVERVGRFIARTALAPCGRSGFKFSASPFADARDYFAGFRSE